MVERWLRCGLMDKELRVKLKKFDHQLQRRQNQQKPFPRFQQRQLQTQHRRRQQRLKLRQCKKNVKKKILKLFLIKGHFQRSFESITRSHSKGRQNATIFLQSQRIKVKLVQGSQIKTKPRRWKVHKAPKRVRETRPRLSETNLQPGSQLFAEMTGCNFTRQQLTFTAKCVWNAFEMLLLCSIFRPVVPDVDLWAKNCLLLRQIYSSESMVEMFALGHLKYQFEWMTFCKLGSVARLI